MSNVFSPKGRINSSDFMKAVYILTAITVATSVMQSILKGSSVLGVFSLVIWWCWIVIWIKRYHDAGKSGWTCFLPITVYLILTIVMYFIINSGDLLNLIELVNSDASLEEQQAARAKMKENSLLPNVIGYLIPTLGTAILFNHIIKSDPDDNQYGPSSERVSVFD